MAPQARSPRVMCRRRRWRCRRLSRRCACASWATLSHMRRRSRRRGRRHAGACRALRSRRIRAWCWSRRSRCAGARRAFYAGMTALTDALIGTAEPETAVAIDLAGRDPGQSRPGRRRPPRLAGGCERGRGSALAGVRRHDPRAVDDRQEPGVNPQVTALDEEGFIEVTRTRAVESFARHFMVAIDAWQESGFGAVAKDYLPRLAARERPAPRASTTTAICWCAASGSDALERRSLAASACRAVLARSGNRGAAGMKLLRTIRLDPSDTFVFDQAAEPGEWAVSGAFAFWDGDPTTLDGKARSAFRSGFLGVESLGWSTLVQIVEASEADRAAAGRGAGAAAGRAFGAPDMQCRARGGGGGSRLRASLCTQPQDTLVAVHRTYEDGEVREQFRTLRPRDGASRRAPSRSWKSRARTRSRAKRST